jgi:hypothetical protein
MKLGSKQGGTDGGAPQGRRGGSRLSLASMVKCDRRPSVYGVRSRGPLGSSARARNELRMYGCLEDGGELADSRTGSPPRSSGRGRRRRRCRTERAFDRSRERARYARHRAGVDRGFTRSARTRSAEASGS